MVRLLAFFQIGSYFAAEKKEDRSKQKADEISRGVEKTLLADELKKKQTPRDM